MDHRLQRIAGLPSLVLGVSLVCHAALAATQAGAAAVEVQPSPGRFLFWTPAEQRFGYRNMERFAERQAFFEALRKAVSSAPSGLAG